MALPLPSLARYYIGTNAIGSSALALSSTKMYVKKVQLFAGQFLASIDVYLHTTDGEQVSIRPVMYDDNAGAPGKLISFQDTAPNSVEFNGVDRWVTLPVSYYSTSYHAVWIGVHAPDPGSLTIAYETSGGDDQQINSGSTWTIDPAATGGSITDPGSHLYSIRGSVITGLTRSQIGRTDVGGSWLAMGNGPVYLRSVTIPAGSCLAAVVGHFRHQVANVPTLAGYVWGDSGGAPSLLRFAAPVSGTSILMSTAGRWVYCPVGLWVETETVFWIGWQMLGSESLDFAYDASGSDGGSLASASDSATWTSGDDSYSFHALVLP